jgi:tetratricopeptide (TPR) repeat protein
MKFIRRNFYLISISLFGLLVFAIVAFRKKEPDRLYPLLDRKGQIALGGEWINTKKSIEGYLDILRKNPNDDKTRLKLAEAYFQEARVTGNHVYYDKAALSLLNNILDRDPNNFEALATKTAVYLSQHHFSDGLELAKQAQKLDPYSAYAYGLLTDANVELGNYDEAVKMADKMNGTRPDIRSYSRISYVREILGNMPGAIEAMKMSVTAGYPGLENTEWCRIQLGQLYERTGNLPKAKEQYELALSERPDYAYAYAGLGRIEMYNKNYNQAIKYFEIADGQVNDYSFGDELIDLYRLNNNPKKADSIAQEVINKLNEDSQSADKDNNIGHYSDKELAYLYLKVHELDKALDHAQIEYNRRPENIDVEQTLAWVHYSRGEYKDALDYITKAVRTHSQNPTLLYQQGLILIKNNKINEGREELKKAVATDPFLSPDLLAQGKPYLS